MASTRPSYPPVTVERKLHKEGWGETALTIGQEVYTFQHDARVTISDKGVEVQEPKAAMALATVLLFAAPHIDEATPIVSDAAGVSLYVDRWSAQKFAPKHGGTLSVFVRPNGLAVVERHGDMTTDLYGTTERVQRVVAELVVAAAEPKGTVGHVVSALAAAGAAWTRAKGEPKKPGVTWKTR